MDSGKNPSAFKALSVINAILILLCAAGCIYIITANVGDYYFVSAAMEFLALLFAGLYYIRGFKKDAAKYYRLFMLFYAFTYLVEILAGASSYDSLGVSSSALTLAVSMILYGNTLLLALGKDLGKKASYTLCGISVFFYLLPIIGCLIPGIITYGSAALKASNVILYCTWFILALNALIMTIAKYTDKKMRGTN